MSASGAAEFVHDINTVHFAQPRLSQFVPEGSETGTFVNTNQSAPISLENTPNNNPALTGGNTLKSATGTVYRMRNLLVEYVVRRCPDICLFRISAVVNQDSLQETT